MKIKFAIYLLCVVITVVACSDPQTAVVSPTADSVMTDTLNKDTIRRDSLKAPMVYHDTIHTGNTTPEQLVAFAQTLVDVPYKYASVDPHEGFDCSGFITYIFNHFGIAVPRSSIDFTHVGKPVPKQMAKPGDLILFTGTDSTIREVGHMGLITSNDQQALSFIHSSSGKANGVVITPLNDYYLGRFVKVIRVFPEKHFAVNVR